MANKKLKKSIKIKLHHATKVCRKGKYVAAVITYNDVRCLAHVFGPRQHTALKKAGREQVVNLMSKMNDFAELEFVESMDYPTDLGVDQVMCPTYSVMQGMEKVRGKLKGYNIRKAFKETEADIVSFKDGIAWLLKEHPFCILANGFGWWNDSARRKLGVNLIKYKPRTFRST